MGKLPTKIEQYSSDEDSGSESELSPLESSEEEQSEAEAYSDEGSKQAQLRKQLADVPFEQLIRLQRQIKPPSSSLSHKRETKAQVKRDIRRALRQQTGKESESEETSDSSGPETMASKPSRPQANKGQFHRETKKMPTMMSSKRPVGRFRQVVDMPQGKTRDPRFDNLSGNFNEDLFEKSYEFLNQQQQEEMDEMRRQIARLKHKSPSEANRIQRALEIMQSQRAAKEQHKRSQELKRTHRKREVEAIKQGKQPFYLGKRDLREMQVAQQFNKLKGSSKLDKVLEKRRKRNANKDHRSMPYQRRDE
ncbi:rRNA biogenesis protein rrp36 [Coemansia brasiliensis]|uniref:rRNA biogenesis protein RRP36 n=1 Tax=Coemansia brasiliensis TaxID=2650707 RepID=A0A9W8M203_9FUNG|nr:rRNA biogenesis protein rrp36 [Coemansia brasiliensis]